MSCGLASYAVLLCNWSASSSGLVTDLLATFAAQGTPSMRKAPPQRVRHPLNVQVLQELDERVQRMNEEHRRDARRRAEELVQPLLAPDFFAQ